MTKLFCKLPFTRISIDDDGNVWPSCCPDWVAFPLGNVFEQSWDEIWYGDTATKFRDSMFDGSLRYCKRNWCPHVADAESGIKNYQVIPHSESPATWVPQPPVHVNLNYDMTCNLKCPSCRSDYIHYKGDKLNRLIKLHKYVEEQILPQVESIALTGVGDPFMSQVFREFLFNFDSKKYPNIKTVHLHTNGQLFDEKTYSQMKGLHDINLSTDISIDAASADVYDVVRPPGNWNKLMRNLEFIKKLDNLVLLGISMVVQQANYRQMMQFVELGESLVYRKRNTFVEFKRIRHDPHLTREQFQQIGIDEMPMNMKDEFINELYKIEKKRIWNAYNNIRPAINHNLQEYITKPVAAPTKFELLTHRLSSIFTN